MNAIDLVVATLAMRPLYSFCAWMATACSDFFFRPDYYDGMKRLPVLLLSFAILTHAQTNRTVHAGGSSTIAVTPDQATIDAGVTVTASTAADSAAQNAAMTTAVLNVVKAVIGANGSVQTIGYSIYPRYTTNSTINGYTSNNTIRITTTDLSILGKLIDAAYGAGANNAGNLSFGLQDPEPYVQQALTAATKQAMAHANAIAAGLNAKIGAVISAQEGSSYAPVAAAAGLAAAATVTPVQTG